MRSYWSRVVLIQYDWCPYKRGKFGHRHIGRRTPCEGEGRDWGDASTSQGTPKIASKLSEARGETRNRFSFEAHRRNQPYQHFDFGFPASGTVGKYISVA